MAEPAGTRALLPLFLGLVLLLAVHGPFLRVPPLLEERTLLDAPEGIVGWMPGTRLTQWELAHLPPAAHRPVGLLLEAGILAALFVGLCRLGAPVLVAAALPLVYLLHPAHTGTALLLGSRPVLYGEALLALGVLLAAAARPLVQGIGLVGVAGGALGLPAVTALALPFLGRGSASPGRRITVALLAGCVGGAVVRAPAGAWTDGLAGARVFWQPGSFGLVLPADAANGPALVASAALGLVLLLLAPRSRRGVVAAGALGAALALLAGPATRPVRLDLGRVGREWSPDVFLPFVAALLLLLVLALRDAEGRRRWLPLATLAFLVPGFVQARVFGSEERLLLTSSRLAPASPSVALACAELFLGRGAGAAGPGDREAAREAFRAAELAVRLGAGRRAESARILALARLGKEAEAREAWARLREETGADGDVFRLRGDLELALGDEFAALPWYHEAIRQDGAPEAVARAAELTGAIHARIDDAIRGGATEEARSWCDQLLAAVPDDLLAQEARATTFLLEQDFAQAAAGFREVLDVAPVRRVALKGMIQSLEALDRAEEAAPLRRRLLELGGPNEFQ